MSFEKKTSQWERRPIRHPRPVYPDDGGLKQPVRAYEDTFSAWTVVKEMFFPEMLTERERAQIIARDSKS